MRRARLGRYAQGVFVSPQRTCGGAAWRRLKTACSQTLANGWPGLRNPDGVGVYGASVPRVAGVARNPGLAYETPTALSGKKGTDRTAGQSPFFLSTACEQAVPLGVRQMAKMCLGHVISGATWPRWYEKRPETAEVTEKRGQTGRQVSPHFSPARLASPAMAGWHTV